jgi:hypothetical protein
LSTVRAINPKPKDEESGDDDSDSAGKDNRLGSVTIGGAEEA